MGKLADRLHNMRTLNALTPEKQRIIAQETMNVFVPLANRLGVWSIKAELEDLCFRYLNQSEFLALQNCMKEDFMKSQKENLQKNLDKLQDELKARNFGIKDLGGRPKNIYGIHKKMKTKGITFEEVYDLCACRVIVKSKSECYKVLDLIHSIWEPVEGKFRDYVKNPKENGYESLHTVVVDEHGNPFEIQIRTAEMHFIAEYGVAPLAVQGERQERPEVFYQEEQESRAADCLEQVVADVADGASGQEVQALWLPRQPQGRLLQFPRGRARPSQRGGDGLRPHLRHCGEPGPGEREGGARQVLPVPVQQGHPQDAARHAVLGQQRVPRRCG